MEKDKICCDAFLKIAPHLGWFMLDDKFIMPYIANTRPQLRVNFCPSCGKEVRDIELKDL